MDQFYFESGYFDGKYFVYVAEARIDLTPYLSEGYFDPDYFLYQGISSTLSAELTEVIGEVKDFAAAFSAVASQTALVGKIIEYSSAISDAFTPTMTASALRNHQALLESVAEMQITGAVNRSADIALENLANLNAMADKTTDIESTVVTTATQTTSAVYTANSQSNIESTLTLTSDILSVQLASSDLTSTSALTIRRYFNGRPRTSTTVGSPGFNTTDKKFGTAAYDFATNNYVEYAATPDYTTIKTIDFWFYQRQGTGSYGAQVNLLEWRLSPTNFKRIRLLVTNTGLASFTIDQTISGSASVKYEKTFVQANYPNNAWYHYRILDSGTAITLWINGQKITGNSGTYSNDGLGMNLGLMVGNVSSFTQTMDELLLTQAVITDSTVSSFTPPTTAWRFDDQEAVLLLAHFDGDFTDDVSITAQGQASVASETTLSATANPSTKTVTATLLAQSQLTASASSTQDAQAQLSTQATLDAGILKIKQFAIDLTATSACVATANIQQALTATLSCTSTVSLIPSRIRFLHDLTTYFEGGYIDNDYFRSIGLRYDAIAGLSATITKVREVEITVNDFATLSCDFDRIKSAESAQNTTVAVSAEANVTRNALQDATATAALSINAGLLLEGEVTALSLFAPQITVDAILRPEAFLESSTSASVSAAKITDASTAMVVESTLAASAEQIKGYTSDVSSAVTLTTSVSRIHPGLVDLDALSNVVSTINVVRGAVSSQSAVSSLTSTANYNIDNALVFDSIATKVTAAVKNTNNEIVIQSTATLTALVGVIKQFDNDNAVWGAQFSDDNHWLVYDLDEPVGIYQGQIIHFWLRKDRSDQNGFIITSERSNLPGSPTEDRADLNYYDGSGLRFYTQQNSSIGVPTTSVSLAIDDFLIEDDEWHQYALVIRDWTLNPGRFVTSFFRDGLYIDEKIVTGTRLGHNVAWHVDNKLGFESRISLAQLWIGRFFSDGNPSNETLEAMMQAFYSQGYIDLGSDGEVNSESPDIYAPLAYPFTDRITATQSDINFKSLMPLYGTAAVARLSSTIVGVALFVADLTAVSTQSSTATKTVSAVSTQSTQANITAQSTVNAGAGAALTSEYTILCSAQRTRDVNSQLESAAQQQSTVGLLQSAESTMSALGFVLSEGTVKPPIRAEATLESLSTQTAIVGLLEQAEITIDSAMSFSADVTVIPPITADASVEAEATLICFGSTVFDISSEISSQSQLIADVTLIPPIRAEAAISAETNLTADITVAYEGTILTASLGNLDITVDKFTGIVSDLATETSVDTAVTKLTGIAPTLLEALAFSLSIGRVINLDPALTLTIEPETRMLMIYQETREITIEGETRINTIRG